MSRTPFWLPPGQQSRSIPKFRLEGVEPNSPEAHDLAKAFSPLVKQFYLKMAQQHALGIVDQSKGHRHFGDGLSMSYLNQHGQETVTLKVGTQFRKRFAKGFRRPDWALVNFTLPSQFDVASAVEDPPYLFSVFVKADVKGHDEVVPIQNRGGANWGVNFTTFEILRAAFAGNVQGPTLVDGGTLVDGVYTVSLLIDLRPYYTPVSPAPSVSVDIYALTETQTYEQTGWESSETSSGYATDLDPWPSPTSDFATHKAAYIGAGFPWSYQSVFRNGSEVPWEYIPFRPDLSIAIELDEVPAADLVVTDGDPASTPFAPDEHARWLSYTRDMATGLVTEAVFIGLAGSGTTTTTWGPSRHFYSIDPTFDLVARIDPGPGQVLGRLIYGTPDWAYRRRTRSSPIGAVSAEYIWMPADLADPSELSLATLAEDVAWPVPREFRSIPGSTITPGPAEPSTKLGTIIVDLERNTLAFDRA